MTKDFTAIILAAGKGRRANSTVPKVLIEIDGRPIISHVLETVARSKPKNILVVVGHEAGQVSSAADEILKKYDCEYSFVLQSPLLGTGHAIKLAVTDRNDLASNIISINADDSALLSSENILDFLRSHTEAMNILSLGVCAVDDCFRFGRVIASPPTVLEFVNFEENQSRSVPSALVATGAYVFDSKWLLDNLNCFYMNSSGELPIYCLALRACDQMFRWNTYEFPRSAWASTNTPNELTYLRSLFSNKKP